MALLPNFMSGIKTPTFIERQTSSASKQQLLDDVSTAVSILQRLTAEVEDASSGEKAARLPRGLVKMSQAVAIVMQTKAGIGLGVQFGCGFIISRLGPNQWSAPSYFTIRMASAGLTFGYEKVESAICIKDESSLEKFMELEFVLGTDVMLHLQLDPQARDVPGTVTTQEVNTRGPEKEAGVATFSMADGAGLDISFKGGVTYVDNSTNQALFGQDATPAKLLKGEIPPPPEFTPLYELLNQIGAEA